MCLQGEINAGCLFMAIGKTMLSQKMIGVVEPVASNAPIPAKVTTSSDSFKKVHHCVGGEDDKLMISSRSLLSPSAF